MPLLKGLSFPLKFNKRGSLSTTTSVDKIKENIKALILTAAGERLMSPRLGTVGYEHLFRNIDPLEIGLIKHQIRMGVEAGESRVTVVDVEVAQPEVDGQLQIHMTFKIDTSNEFENLTFYL